ncbi:hypothetical protein FHU37_003005 [Allostreptomyces psammosilenae]|uniref:Uncharacterized protein n=1 Tax=Allostreptomyces psammosilenae TaxID=1892865 RepID=A0A853A6G1_9ACTN|nr:hypothetical protein [Allostreptomyces psammosilenae]
MYTTTMKRGDKAEARGAMNAYLHMAEVLLIDSHGLSAPDAERQVKVHVRRWIEAANQESYTGNDQP